MVSGLEMKDGTKFFEGNLRVLGETPAAQAAKDREKYNLYCGLLNITNQLSDLQTRIDRLREQVRKLERSVTNG